MAPSAILPTTIEASKTPNEAVKPRSLTEPAKPAEPVTVASPPNAILHRTSWTPPVAVRGEGIYVDLEDGPRIIDAVGGAAVNCIGSGHPKVIQAITDQLQKLICTY
jgi:4-aminobutyrate aminotransferase-like enzyme